MNWDFDWFFEPEDANSVLDKALIILNTSIEIDLNIFSQIWNGCKLQNVCALVLIDKKGSPRVCADGGANELYAYSKSKEKEFVSELTFVTPNNTNLEWFFLDPRCNCRRFGFVKGPRIKLL